MSFLLKILNATREDVDKRKRDRPLSEIMAALAARPARPDNRPFLRALGGAGISVIAEFKRRSPSMQPSPSNGLLHKSPDLRQIVRAYELGHASALSVLTESTNFGGSLEDLRAARAACSLPILRKDFIIDEYQVYEAAEAGADAVLLIVSAIGSQDELSALQKLARSLALDVLIEIRNEVELDRALSVSADLIGINNRDLQSLEIHVETTYQLLGRIPSGITIVSESGLKDRDDLDKLEASGVHAALIGSTLMQAADAEAKCLSLTQPKATPTRVRPLRQPALA